jgi:carboxypeptidase family protein
MIDFRKNRPSPLGLSVLLIFAAVLPVSAQRTVSIHGQVRDKTKIPLPGAMVTFQSAGSRPRRMRTNKAGAYAFLHLTPGQYTVRVEARGFQTYEAQGIHVSGSQNVHLNFTLDLAPVKQEIVVASGDKPLTVEPESSPSSILLSGAGTSGLPDDPNDFFAAVQALAGPSVLGAFGLQVFVNGLINSQMPPKETISQIRINDNPFSSENDRPATDRIDVITKGGGRELHGETYMNQDVGRWDARNPFAAPLPPDASNLYGANVGGPLGPRVSFFVSIEQAEVRFKNAIQATVLDASLVPKAVSNYEHDFERSLNVSPRLDIILNQKNTLMVSYSLSGYVLPHEGVGGTSLPESGYRIASNKQTIQLSETAILTPKLIDETKFQFLRTNLVQTPTTMSTGISVDQAFITGNRSAAMSSLYQRPWEFQNNLTATLGPHVLRTGIRVRGDHSHEIREENEFGTYLFSSGTGPELGVDNAPTQDALGHVIPVSLTALDRYRRTVLFEGEGMSPAAIRLLGGGASSFFMYSGNPLAQVQQYDLGVYVQDDWHIRPNLLLGAGIRYEAQTHLQDRLDVGPRFSFAWAPAKSAKGHAHTVLRGGIGLFYQRLDDSLVLQANHSATPHFRYLSTDPSVLDQFPGTPSMSSLRSYAVGADTVRLDPHLRAPATLQTSFGLEQELPFKTRLSATITAAKTTRDLLLRDVSAFQTGHQRFLNLQSTGELTSAEGRS